MAALVIAEHDNNTVRGATLNTVTAALACSSEVHLLVAGTDAAAAAHSPSRWWPGTTSGSPPAR